jgi:integrase
LPLHAGPDRALSQQDLRPVARSNRNSNRSACRATGETAARHTGGIERDRTVGSIGQDPTAYGTHTLRRTKATLIYRRTKNLRAVQLLLGHTRLESTVRYLGIEVDDALEIAEQTET